MVWAIKSAISTISASRIPRVVTAGVPMRTPLVTNLGLVGRILRSSAHTATALLLTDPSSRIAVLAQESRSSGILTGQGPGRVLEVSFMERGTDVNPGEILITSGLDGKFPKGIPVARVLSVAPSNYSQFLAIQAEPLVDLRHLEDFHGVCGRLERVPNARKLHVFVDYAHTPDALVNVLKALRGAGFKRIVTVFGCGGNRDRTKRPIMGEAVARYSDVAVLTSDNPRFEDPEAILKDVLPGLREAREVVVEVDRRKATAKAVEMLGPDDALLIAGKGHEDYQIIQGTKHHYSDQEVVRELLGCA